MPKMTIVLSKKKPLPVKEVEEDMGEEASAEMCECPKCGYEFDPSEHMAESED